MVKFLQKSNKNWMIDELKFMKMIFDIHCPTKSIRTPPNIHVVNRLNIQLGAKMGIEIYRYQRVVVLALLTLVEIFIILGFHEVLIY